MPKLAALTISVGVLAVVATWIFGLDISVAWKLQVWQAFIAWGCHFQSGGRNAGMKASMIGINFGALVGMASVLLAGKLGALGTFGTPLAVGIGAAVICLASAIPLLAVIPASVYGFAAIAGLIIVGGVSATNAIVPTIISVIIGGIFGIVSELVADALAKKDVEPLASGHPAE